MDQLFIAILNNALVTSWFILAVTMLRFFFKKFIKTIPQWVNCLLWGLVAIRLVLPFSIESIFSLIPSDKPIPTDIEYAKIPQIDSGIAAVNTVINPILENNFAAKEIASINPIRVVIIVASYLWIMGVMALLIYACISFLLLKKHVKNAKQIEKGIFKSYAIGSPFILGIIKPSIFVPYYLEEEVYRCIIAHEKAHIKRGDFLWKPLGFVILSVYWFNPLCWLAYICLCKDIEYACDEKVTKDKDKVWKAKYCQALLDCSAQRHLVSACPVAFGEVSVKDRIKSVINYKKPSFWIVCISILTAIIVAICFMTNPKQKEMNQDSTAFDLTKDVLETGDTQNTADTTEEKDAATVYYQLIHDIEAAMYDPSLRENNPEVYKDSDGNGICSDEFFAHLYDGSDDIAYQNLGYLIKDIDGDGTQELLLGENDPNPDGDYNGIVYDLYTYREGKLQHIFSGWPRNRYYLTNSNEIICEWSNASDDYGKTHYLYENGSLTEIDSWEGVYSYYLPQFNAMGPVWIQVDDLNEDTRPDYVIRTGMDGYYNKLSLYLTGEGKVFEHEDANIIELGNMLCAIDIDHDGVKEITLSMAQQVNSAGLMKYAVLKKGTTGWYELPETKYVNPENDNEADEIELLPLEQGEIDLADENMGVSYREHPINHTYKVEDLGDENLNVDYVKNNNHYVVDGDMVLQYKKVLEGHAPDSQSTIRYIVLTNDENVTWEQVYRSLHSDKNEDKIYGTIIIGIKEIAYDGNENTGAKRSTSMLSEGVHPSKEEVKVFWRG